MNPNQQLTVRRKSKYIVKMSSDTSQTVSIVGMPSDKVIVSDSQNNKVKLLDQHYNVSSHCDVSGSQEICQITSSEVAVTFNKDVKFISVSNGQLVSGRKISLQHAAYGIAHHEGIHARIF
ncbi:hypothetical protein DPMN_046288 [Dreissena polymorpha]|uniref:Uncharacterized protein n=1 Tax=Dreissena polymorpha TaxID=45954 RepID=A0A9D4D7L2_DREPO|nr:hypothetical protein DPMN_046288 [Dreissena polymorpha]